MQEQVTAYAELDDTEYLIQQLRDLRVKMEDLRKEEENLLERICSLAKREIASARSLATANARTIVEQLVALETNQHQQLERVGSDPVRSEEVRAQLASLRVERSKLTKCLLKCIPDDDDDCIPDDDDDDE